MAMPRFCFSLLIALALFVWPGAGVARAQEHGEHAEDDGVEPPHVSEVHPDRMTGPIDLPLAQSASGTAWQPASTPMYGHMWHAGDWNFMLHHLFFAGLDAQGSDQGSTEAFSANWVMGMVQHPLFGGQLALRSMISFDAPLLGKDGYALLLQTGETADGVPLVDEQHPHDLFMELALLYDRALTGDLAFQLYAAAAGEPALGPPAFPHRVSAFADPMAPISHHWQDSTHILFSVFTAGLYTRRVKVEGSWFSGREPDEDRYDIELRAPDSYSFRLSVNPSEAWSSQVSYGFLREPEATAPGEDIDRITASLTWNRRLGRDDNWATTFVWGQNRSEEHEPSNAFLLESNLLLLHHNFFGRAEYVQKSGHDFALEDDERVFDVGVIALGYLRNFGPFADLVPGIGVRGSMNFVPTGLEDRYGTRLPLGLVLYVRLRAAEMQHSP